jgi:hypothetical protein
MGLVGVVATQLWHHTFIDACLADLPAWTPVDRSVRNGEPLHQAAAALGDRALRTHQGLGRGK